MRLQTGLGRIPSTGAGTDDGAWRRGSFAVLRLLPRNLPDGWRIRLTPDHQFRLEVQAEVQPPTTATAMVTELTGFLLNLAPYLDALEELGVTPGRG